MGIERELMRGSGPLAVLQLLSRREMYGYELVTALTRETGGVLAMGQSTLYPLLYNLEAKGWISSRSVDSDVGRVRRYYTLTRAGQKELDRQRADWRSLARAMQALGIIGSGAGGG
jgi:PadR family transcriptional regulator PadR